MKPSAIYRGENFDIMSNPNPQWFSFILYSHRLEYFSLDNYTLSIEDVFMCVHVCAYVHPFIYVCVLCKFA